jgi:hypothetical protein
MRVRSFHDLTNGDPTPDEPFSPREAEKTEMCGSTVRYRGDIVPRTAGQVKARKSGRRCRPDVCRGIESKQGNVVISEDHTMFDSPTSASEADILSRVIEPEQAGLSEAAARSMLAFGFRDSDRRRMNVLAERARAGTLSVDEQIEAYSYERVGHFLALLQSKARRSLSHPTTSPTP